MSLPAWPALEPGLQVAGQIDGDTVAALAAAGYRSLICNRPDGEVPEQTSAADIAAAAAEHGLAFRMIPVLGAAISDADIAAFRRALDELPRPVLAYCRSGNRCTLLWALARADQIEPDALIDRARQAGYAIDALRPRMQQRAAVSDHPPPAGHARDHGAS